MTSSTPDFRVHRALEPDELQKVLDAITATTTPADLGITTVFGTLGPLLGDEGIAIADLGPDRQVDPSQYAIPLAQWLTISGAATVRAAEWGASSDIAFYLVDAMPSFYEDPSVTAPAIPNHDYRPLIHELHVPREACDVIAACEAHVDALRDHYGRDSQTYQTAADSWHGLLVGLFHMGFGADSHVRRDGDLTLTVTTGSGLIYGILFHPQQRSCTSPDCHALIGDDGAPYTAYPGAVMLEHEHTPVYPLDAPQPGKWLFHS